MKTKVPYKTSIEQRKIGDKLYVLEVIRNLDEAIDLLCELMEDDPFAEDLCPYFGVLWPAAEGLAEFLNDNPELVNAKAVLELGSGLGLPSLVAAHLNAKVLTTDFHPDVQEYFLRNCRHSVVNCDYLRLNWRDNKHDIGKFDVVMGSDILYESKHPSEVAEGLIRYLKPGGKIILADPGRAYLAQFLQAMDALDYKLKQIHYQIGDKSISINCFSLD